MAEGNQVETLMEALAKVPKCWGRQGWRSDSRHDAI
jgi:hypothetical protein